MCVTIIMFDIICKYQKGEKMKRILICILIAAISLSFVSCAKKTEYTLDDGSTITLKGEKVKVRTKQEDGKMLYDERENIKVKVEMEDGGIFVMELYPQYAPETVRNFADLVEEGFYDGLTFHRIVAGFVAQGGDPEGTGMGGSGTNITGEFKNNGFAQNTLSHEKTVVSMARSRDMDSASSQFFICLEDAKYLDGDYAAFGKVVYGMEEVEKMADVPTDYNDKPLTPVVMKELSIITDEQYEELAK